jgi:hypothetical protein
MPIGSHTRVQDGGVLYSAFYRTVGDRLFGHLVSDIPRLPEMLDREFADRSRQPLPQPVARHAIIRRILL